MLLKALALTCPCYSQNLRYVTTDGPTVSINSKENERISFFEIDDKTNTCSEFREKCGMDRPGNPICDLLISYSNKKSDVWFCLVEVKGSESKSSKTLGDNLLEASEQITNTYKKCHEQLETEIKSYKNNYKVHWACCIVTSQMGHGSAHTQNQKIARDVRQRLPKIPFAIVNGNGVIVVKDGRLTESQTKVTIGDFLRETSSRGQTSNMPGRRKR